ncbi:MAG: hypothetical protein CBD88_00775 [Flavobacteriales bacterium TMED228]|jgi:hypothetical protein|nr:MAG: hypothetical protein CBD88_00775 [Flavobacteriales bacterium TMED228]|tara:strand:- start:3701 stop:4354 length:654 start_codon:yes stop_codon:yes gene_type:complete
MLSVDVRTNIKEVTKDLYNFEKVQIPYATSFAINDTLFGTSKKGTRGRMGGLANELKRQMKQKLDRPKTTTLNNMWWFTYSTYKKSKPSNYLRGVLFIKKDFSFMGFQIDGGTRIAKTRDAVPFKNRPLMDAHGNIKGKRKLVKNKKQFIATIKGISGVWERIDNGGVKLLIGFEKVMTYDNPQFDFYGASAVFIAKNFNEKLAKSMSFALKMKKKR